MQQPESSNNLLTWVACRYSVTKSHDFVKAGSWVFYQDNSNQVYLLLILQIFFLIFCIIKCTQMSAGRILDIRCPDTMISQGSSSGGFIFIQQFIILEANDPHYNMPVLLPSPVAPANIVIPANVSLSISFI